MTDNPSPGGNQPPQNDSGASVNPSEPSSSDDIDFTPEQQKRLGKILSAEREKVKSQYADYDDIKKKLKEIEREKLTEAEKLQLERDEAKKEAETWKKKAEKGDALELRTKLFAEFKTKSGDSLPSHLLKYVKGKGEEEILKSIESVASDFGLKATNKKGTGGPIPPGGTEPPDKKHGFMNAQILGAAGRGGR